MKLFSFSHSQPLQAKQRSLKARPGVEGQQHTASKCSAAVGGGQKGGQLPRQVLSAESQQLVQQLPGCGTMHPVRGPRLHCHCAAGLCALLHSVPAGLPALYTPHNKTCTRCKFCAVLYCSPDTSSIVRTAQYCKHPSIHALNFCV